ncbi:MAG: IS66 family transposase [Deltaproteobacteria bacterium]|nr:IS66 family transposase [Deltaproteobacteria bacterium]
MDKNEIKKLSRNELIQLLLAQNNENDNLKNEVSNLTTEISILKKYIFARKNEKWTKEDKEKSQTFDEVENTDAEDSDQKDKNDSDSVKKESKDKKKTGRKPLPASIPRKKVVFDIEDDESLCPCCGKKRPQMGSSSAEELEFLRAQILVKEYITKKYGACSCNGFQSNMELPQVIEAKAPARFIPGSIASPSLVAQIVVSKFVDGIPLYRQERIFKRIDIEISRQNMSNWCLTASRKCGDILEQMREIAINGTMINMDETTVQVLKENNREPNSKSYMWVMVGGSVEKKVVLFNYSPTRKQEKPLTLLEGFKGILQTDGYAAYNKAVKEYGLWHVGCLTHARRKFYKLAEVTKKKGKAHKGVEFFTRLYKIETKLKMESLSPEDFLKKRRKLAIPIWQEFHKWLTDISKKIAPGSKLDLAINYSLNQYKNLVRYLRYPEISPDNNIAENAIRPFCVGRKNWLFNITPRGAHSSAALYSLIETAKANKVEPDLYLNYIFSEIPKITDKTDLDALMPWNMPQKTL